MKKALIIVVSVAVLCLVGMLGTEWWLRRTIRTAIESTVAGAGAKVSVGRVSASVLKRSVTVHNITVHRQNNDPAHRGFTVVSLDADIGSISARGIGYKKSGGKPAITATDLVIRSPRATLVTKGEKEASTEHKKTLRQILSEHLALLSIEKISLIDAAVDYVAWKSDDRGTRISVGGGDLKATGFVLDSLPAAPDRILFSDNVTLTADSVACSFGTGEQTLRAHDLALDAAAKTLSIERFALVPEFPEHEFARRSKTHEDWTEATMENIACTGLDYAELISGRAVKADSISLAGARVASYKNRKVHQVPRTKPMIWQTIQRLPLPLDIRHIAFSGVAVEYDELASDGDTPGVVTITDGRGTVKNLTNITKDHDRFFTVEVAATLMPDEKTEGGAMQATCLFPVSAMDDHWEISGRVGPTDMAAFNRAIEPLMNVRIKSGVVRSLDFQLTGTLAESHIRLTMAYDDLSVAILRKHDHSHERGLLTFLADDILIRPDNPGRDGRGRLREGEGIHKHDPQRSMYNYIWRSFVPAIAKTVI